MSSKEQEKTRGAWEERQPGKIRQAGVFYDSPRGEQIPVLDPVTGGEDQGPVELAYDPGDGSARMIPDPLGVLNEVSIAPFFPVMENPSANVPA